MDFFLTIKCQVITIRNFKHNHVYEILLKLNTIGYGLSTKPLY